jgi:multicomponent Na+:H+ antiporter subunit G
MQDAGIGTAVDIVSALCLVVGALMSLAAGIGMLRFPDLLSRMHAATKPQVLGMLLMLTAVGLQLGQWSLVPALLLAWLFQLLTAPVSAHMVGRSGYRTKHLKKETLVLDDLDEVVSRAADGHLHPVDGAGRVDALSVPPAAAEAGAESGAGAAPQTGTGPAADDGEAAEGATPGPEGARS